MGGGYTGLKKRGNGGKKMPQLNLVLICVLQSQPQVAAFLIIPVGGISELLGNGGTRGDGGEFISAYY